MKVLIDCGHGIETSGKRSPDGLFREYLWNRQVGDILLGLFELKGFDAQLVVRETNDISLRTRVQRVNNVCNLFGASDVLLVSIHSNAVGDGKNWMSAKGWSCYTTKGETKSDLLSECLYDIFERDFPDRKIRKEMSDGDRDYEENFYILSKTRCPAVLVENFFYDNKEECAWLLKEETKNRIARSLYYGIVKYMALV